MSETFQVSLVTPQGEVYSRAVVSLVAPGAEGSFGVLARHAPFLSALQPGVLEVSSTEGRDLFVVGGGVVEVSRDGVLVLADTAERVDDREKAKALVAGKDGH